MSYNLNKVIWLIISYDKKIFAFWAKDIIMIYSGS